MLTKTEKLLIAAVAATELDISNPPKEVVHDSELWAEWEHEQAEQALKRAVSKLQLIEKAFATADKMKK